MNDAIFFYSFRRRYRPGIQKTFLTKHLYYLFKCNFSPLSSKFLNLLLIRKQATD
jgi:hypothetical protein